MTEPKRASLFVVNAALASGVLSYAVRLSASGRNAVDWIVIGLVVAAILYNIVQLSRRLHRSGGGRAVWHVQRTVLFWIIGVMNTALLRPEHVGTWRHWVGWGILLLAAIETIALFKKEREAVAAEPAEPGAPRPKITRPD